MASTTSTKVSNCLWSAQSAQNFRPDLDADEQIQSLRQFRAKERSDIQMARWKTTLASKGDHLAMISLLLHEAYKFHAVRNKERNAVKRTLGRIRKSILLPFEYEDHYLPALSVVSQCGLFSRLGRTITEGPTNPAYLDSLPLDDDDDSRGTA